MEVVIILIEFGEKKFVGVFDIEIEFWRMNEILIVIYNGYGFLILMRV